MPEKGTSLIMDTLRPVQNPRNPSCRYIFLVASIIELYSLNPMTSYLVLIMIIGLPIMHWKVRAMALDVKAREAGYIISKAFNFCSKKYSVEKYDPLVRNDLISEGARPLMNPGIPSDL